MGKGAIEDRKEAIVPRLQKKKLEPGLLRPSIF